jgi:MFS family permease
MIENWARTTFKSLENRNYRILWIGTSLSFLAFMMSSIVQSVVAFNLTGRNGAVGAVALGMGVATIFISPFGGVIADRVSKRRLLLVGQVIIGLNFAVVGILILTDQITLAWLIASTFVLGAVFAFIGPARQAWMGELLPGSALPNAIALQQIAMTATRIVGPFLAGGLIALAFVGTGGTYLFMAGLFAIVVLTLGKLPQTQSRPKGTGPSVMGDFKLGIGHLKERPPLLLLVLSFIGITMTGFSYFVVLPGYLENEIGRDSRDISLMFGMGAVAGLIVTLGLAGAAGTRYAWQVMVVGGVVLGIALLFTAVSQNFGQALITMLFVGAGSSVFQLINNSLVMQNSDPAFYGRVMSITMLAWGLNSLAGFPLGLLADRIGERESLFIMGLLVLVVTGITALLRFGFIRGEIPVQSYGRSGGIGGD